ncbi:beta-lactamase-like protein [Podospora appendiculata]|uniref:Beta-lactamase-like protein n=1 Tax=Podospora appendiculata TaxID=314037 RepID=A0AAE0XCP4_9PEZI|nr:beta-lactamase-like protein [Podospora appendiculata]
MPALPPLPEVSRLSATTIRILAGNPSSFTLQGTNTYLVGTGPSRLLIDTGEGQPSWLSALQRTLASESATVTTAILTHWHHDHVGGVSQLLSLCPNTKIYKAEPASGTDQLDIHDGQRFEVEGAAVTAYHTPGHTTDHMVLVLEGKEDAMFTGDNVLGHGTAVFEDLETYVDSLDRMRGLFGGRAYPGHGPVIEDGRARIAEYIAHRRGREEQVVATLRTSGDASSASSSATNLGSTPTELVKIIYRDMPEGLHPAAARGVVQILKKLEAEGKVVVDGHDRWRLATTDRPAL